MWFHHFPFSHLAMALKLPVRKAELPHASSTLKIKPDQENASSTLKISLVRKSHSILIWKLVSHYKAHFNIASYALDILFNKSLLGFTWAPWRTNIKLFDNNFIFDSCFGSPFIPHVFLPSCFTWAPQRGPEWDWHNESDQHTHYHCSYHYYYYMITIWLPLPLPLQLL